MIILEGRRVEKNRFMEGSEEAAPVDLGLEYKTIEGEKLSCVVFAEQMEPVVVDDEGYIDPRFSWNDLQNKFTMDNRAPKNMDGEALVDYGVLYQDYGKMLSKFDAAVNKYLKSAKK